jgi:hypothetical protein
MRALVAMMLVAGCYQPNDATCAGDADCTGGDVCAHTHECLPPAEVHAVTIRWTIDGAPASATTCAGISQLEVGYRVGFDEQTRLLFAPVPCDLGSFPNDKWPIDFDTALIYADGATGSSYQTGWIAPDPVANVAIDVRHP